jgi:hypothetical protein
MRRWCASRATSTRDGNAVAAMVVATRRDRCPIRHRRRLGRKTMRYYCLEPEVPGDIGDNTVADWTTHPPTVTKLHYEMEYPPDDALLASFPCWIATVATMNAIKSAALTGAIFDAVEVTMTEQLREFEPDLILPDFVWLKIDGKAGQDDFGVARKVRLVVSERALKLLKRFGISHAEITDYGT